MLPYATVYGEMLVKLLRGGPGSSIKEVAQAAGRQLGVDVAAMVRADGQRTGIGSDPMTACMYVYLYAAICLYKVPCYCYL